MDELDGDGGVARFLTLADTAEILNISARQAYALVRSGELPAIKIGGAGHWRIEKSLLEAYIAAKYEEARRIGLWNQAEYEALPEYSFDRGDRRWPGTDGSSPGQNFTTSS
ncbi:helix-turn-helix domain-containing protein [Marisediminicola senii]|uniref:helix-turn-helix domain-containing protein n=1 Tax=Marisediminicola senii TaxID=2711233 RepID=UPI0013ED5D39|nr:helix-turn-helix domain-containing protein [Marisediminicola senii]